MMCPESELITLAMFQLSKNGFSSIESSLIKIGLDFAW